MNKEYILGIIKIMIFGILVAGFVSLLPTRTVSAGICSTLTDGVWDATNILIWSCEHVPTQDDAVIILHDISLSFNTTVSSLEIDNVLTVSGSYKLTVRGTWTDKGTFNHGTGEVIFQGGSFTTPSISSVGTILTDFYDLTELNPVGKALDIQHAINVTNNFTVNRSTVLNAPIYVEGNILIASDAAILTAKNDITLVGNWVNNGTFAPNCDSTNGFTQVIFKGTSKQISGLLDTAFCTVLIDSGASLTQVSTTISIGRDWINKGTFSHGGKTVGFVKNANGIIDGSAGTNDTTFFNLTIYKDPNFSLTIMRNINVDNDLVILQGTLNGGSSFYSIYILGNWTNNDSFIANNSTVIFNGGVKIQTIDGTKATTFYNLSNRNPGSPDATAKRTYILRDANTSTIGNYHVSATGIFLNNGLYKSRSVAIGSTPATYTFGLASSPYTVYNNSNFNIYIANRLMQIYVADKGNLTNIIVDRVDFDHPNVLGTRGNGTGTFAGYDFNWTIRPTCSAGSCDTGTYIVDVQLPYANDLTSPKVCFWQNSTSLWDCLRTSYSDTNKTVTRTGLTAADVTATGSSYSDWVVGNDGTTATNFSSFNSVPSANGVELKWWANLIGTEITGFDIQRSEAEDGPYVAVNGALIPIQLSGDPTGVYYCFVDNTARPGITYYYQLVGVNAENEKEVLLTQTVKTYAFYLPAIKH